MFTEIAVLTVAFCDAFMDHKQKQLVWNVHCNYWLIIKMVFKIDFWKQEYYLISGSSWNVSTDWTYYCLPPAYVGFSKVVFAAW